MKLTTGTKVRTVTGIGVIVQVSIKHGRDVIYTVQMDNGSVRTFYKQAILEVIK